MSRNTLFRLVVFFLGIPLLAASAFIGRNHGLPIFGILVVGASALAAREAAFFFPSSLRDYPGSTVIIPLMGTLIPTVGYVSSLTTHWDHGSAIGASAIVVPTFMVAASLIMAVQVVKRIDHEIDLIVPVVTSHLFILIYPGLFTWHAARLVSFEYNSELLLLFFLSVYLNDSLAWLFGRLLGPITRRRDGAPPVAISPNKSIVGFVAGFLTSIAVIVLAGIVRPEVLPGPTILHAVFGAIIGSASIVGDLVESGFKRSAAVKDSGQLIPGRGGLLDSIDSAVFVAPFFFYGCVILYGI
ncbi:MAG TPA: phosphatidate cytidylyltransferase [Alkalispirochaeta sp.]|nr:phosphatidate cytidylyltransferase [Alkalispirochaeta sp.]